jgi:ADP-heptose:LPS heptosyltransferase
MKIATLKTIDGYLGRFLIAFFSPLTYLLNLGWPLIFPRGQAGEIKKISYLKIMGGGSLLIAYPAILAVRRKYPDAKIILICSPDVAAFAELACIVDQFSLINTRNLWVFLRSLICALRESWRSDIFVNYELHSKLTTLFCFFTLSERRFGLFQNWNRWQKGYINFPIFYSSSSPIYIGYEQIAFNAGGTIPSWKEACDSFQNSMGLSSSTITQLNDVIGLAPFCSALYREREFSPQQWGDILREQVIGVDLLRVYGGGNDISRSKELCNHLSKIFPKLRIENLTGKTSLAELASNLLSLRKLVTIDSGIIHLSRLLRVPTLSYWGPSDPYLRLRCIDSKVDVVNFKKITCAPCVHEIDIPPCKGNNICMQQYSQEIPICFSRAGWMLND